jgi:hypothetical protein
MIRTRLYNSPRAEKVYKGGRKTPVISVWRYMCRYLYYNLITECFNMAWDTYRRGRHLSIQLPTSVKNELIRIKARGGGTLTKGLRSNNFYNLLSRGEIV